jgi:hypothetical protein
MVVRQDDIGRERGIVDATSWIAPTNGNSGPAITPGACGRKGT